ncbi:ataxin-7-like protein 1 isoform X2 [Brienomyrus brachyistius]|uniref:ataxin-7-like protein 1 isoform X2 n=1 Tax=Brienomyrus brachyistius TaxID=42636 RepID=UPI0020B36A0E|nr:ataxin-7-like protein 1 isoform X2 [Brienomyrus brachyistius]
MATLDGKLPSPDTFLYKPWSTYADAAKLYFCDGVRGDDTAGKELLLDGRGEAMKLSKDERRHGSSSSPRGLSIPKKPKGSLGPDPGGSPAAPARPYKASRDHPHSASHRTPHAMNPPKVSQGKPCLSVPVVSLEKMPTLGRTKTAPIPLGVKSSLMPPASQKPLEKVLNGRGLPGPACSYERHPTTSPATLDRRPSVSPSAIDRRPTPSPSSLDRRLNAPPSPLDRRPNASPSPLDQKLSTPPSPLNRGLSAPPSSLDRRHQNGTKRARLSARVFDPNKHCGVLDPESRMPCTRSLTCKTHSLTHRRAVLGRRKLFDSLLAEHRGRLQESEAGRGKEQAGWRDSSKAQPALSHDCQNGVQANCHDGKGTAALKTRFCLSVNNGTSVTLAVGSAHPCLGGDDGSRISSDEGGAPEDCDMADCSGFARHPLPLGYCSFGSRLMGRGIYVFNRRLYRLRRALQHIVDTHMSSQMWRKVPLAAEGPRSFHGGLPSLQPLGAPGSACLSPSLSSSYSVSAPAIAAPSSDVSMATCLAVFPRGDRVCRPSPEEVDSFVPPSPGQAPMSTQGKKVRAKGSGSQRSAAAGGIPGGRRGRPPQAVTPPWQASLSSLARPCFTAGSSFGAHSAPTNGVPPFCAKAEPLGHTRHSETAKPAGADAKMSLPLVQEHGLLALSRPHGRKHKMPSTYGKASKAAKVAGLSGDDRRSTVSLLAPVSEAPHSAPFWQSQPKVHH